MGMIAYDAYYRRTMFSPGAGVRSVLLAVALIPISCSGSGTSTAPGPVVRPTTEIVASDEVPSLQELRDSGLTDEQADCFTTTIDPDGNGRMSDPELFLEAFSTCVSGG